MDAFLAWLEENKDHFPPKNASAMGQAISYARNRGDTLTRFLDDTAAAARCPRRDEESA